MLPLNLNFLKPIKAISLGIVDYVKFRPKGFKQVRLNKMVPEDLTSKSLIEEENVFKKLFYFFVVASWNQLTIVRRRCSTVLQQFGTFELLKLAKHCAY